MASGRLPAMAAGLERAGESSKLGKLVAEVFGADPVAGRPHACGKGRGIFIAQAKEAAEALAAHVTPSVRMVPLPETVGFAHRRSGDRDLYFFANVGPDDIRFGVKFPGGPRRLEVWDAMDGRIRLAAASGSGLDLAIPARGSIFVVAGGATPDAEPLETTIEAGASSHEGGAAAGKTAMTNAERVALDPEWSLIFEGPDAPPAAKIRTLISWTELPGGRYFSGTGIYRASFDWAGPVPNRCGLRFDQVHEAAEVKLNGRSLGIIFNPPWAVELGPALRQGRNDIEITVVNLPLNRFLGLPDEDLGPLRARFGGRFSAPEEKKVAGGPSPSGLIGAVWLEVRRPD